MDDLPNIIWNTPLHLTNISFDSLWQTFFANQGKGEKLFRPLPNLSFALNWFIGGDRTTGYHVVNFLLHYATACVLFALMCHLLNLVAKKNEPSSLLRLQSVALLAVVFWAAHPIQTQAVTYIVQRMAVMATLFYVLSLFFYVKARQSKSKPAAWISGVSCLLCFLASLLSKENSAILPLSVLLVEWIFFQQGRWNFLLQKKIILSGFFAGVCLFFTAYFIYDIQLHAIFSGYETRSFSLLERVLAQPRIVMMHVTQMFFPMPDRFSIAHDVVLTRSVFTPWTVLPSIMGIFLSLVFALWQSQKRPLLSFAILFFFLNHVVESSILPLELVFEHRNYLPSLFIFLPVSAGIFHLMTYSDSQFSRLLKTMVCGLTVLAIIGVGYSTYIRNKAWATPETLWLDAASKAPRNIRPLINLGIRLAWKDTPTPDNYRHALILFKKSLEFIPTRTTERAEVYGNIGGVYFKQGLYEEAIQAYHQAIGIDPQFSKHRYDLTKALIMTGNFKEAEPHARVIVQNFPLNSNYQNILGLIFLWQDHLDDAIICFRSALKKKNSGPGVLLNLGVALTRQGHHDRGRWFLERAMEKNSREFIPFLALIENRSLAMDYDSARRYARMLIQLFPLPVVNEYLNNAHQNFQAAPVSSEKILPFLSTEVSILFKYFDH